MTLTQLIVYAFLSSTHVTDSERMAAQFTAPTLELVGAGQIKAPVCVEYCQAPTIVLTALDGYVTR